MLGILSRYTEGMAKSPESGPRPDRRTALKAGVFALVGAGAAGAINAGLDTKYEDLRTPEEKINYWRKRKGGFDGDPNFRRDANEPVRGVTETVSRSAFAYQVFSTASAKNMLRGVQAKLATIAPGIAAQESRYNNNIAVSRSGARHIWQLTPVAIAHINTLLAKREPKRTVRIEDTSSLQVATPLVFMYLDEAVYPSILGPAMEVLKKFGLAENEEARDQFLALCMVNGYNAGPGLAARALRTFAETHSPRTVHKTFDGTPLSLYATYADQSKIANVSVGGYRFGPESRDYVLQVLAGAESANAAYKLQYNRPLAKAPSVM